MRRALLAILAASAAAPAAGQPSAWEATQIRVERLAPGIAVIFGRGGNIGLSYGDDGNVLIDDQYAPLTDRILAAVREVDPDPVRFVVNTHWHPDHTGGNENVGRAGAVIVAHDNVRRRLSAGQMLRGTQIPASPVGALPIVTFSDDVTFHLNGDEIRVHHVEHAHTDGDALIHWTRANVLHLGDTFFNGMLPFIDLESGGSANGLIAALDEALRIADARTVIIPGHGPISTRADLQAYRDRLVGWRDQVAAAIRAGRSLDEVKALRLADAHGRDTDFITPDFFIETLYRSLAGNNGERG